MHRTPRLAALAAALLVAVSGAASAQAGQLPAAAHKVLANGLEVFVVENHAVPLATVCVAFRGGASASTADTAGLFHLYEHMLFKGNDRYPNQATWIAARNALGVTDWNGATGGEYINYYVTVPSDRLADGVDFWSAAIRTPRFDPAELETEKGVILSEIKGDYADPDYIARYALDARIFPTYPWRNDVLGPARNIEAAGPPALKALQAGFYIPRNTALLIGGDVTPEAAFQAVERFFGDWKGGSGPVIGEPPQPGLPDNVRLAFRDADFYEGVGNVQYSWRGPDVTRQTKDTYTADVFLFLLSSPVGKFKKAIFEKMSGLYSQEYIDFNYPTARDGGTFSFSTYISIRNPAEEGAILDRAEAMRKVLLEEFALIAADPEAYFGATELAKAKRKLIDSNLLSMENTSSFLTDTLTFWWAVASTDYFFGYEENCSKVSFADIKDLIGDYIAGKPAATEVRVSAKDAKKDLAWTDRAAALGYEAITPANAFWWMK